MTYDLAKQLKDAGFPQDGKGYKTYEGDPILVPKGSNINTYVEQFKVYAPTLSELIEACGHCILLRDFLNVELGDEKLNVSNETWVWGAQKNHRTGQEKKEAFGTTPRNALGKLWLELQK